MEVKVELDECGAPEKLQQDHPADDDVNMDEGVDHVNDGKSTL